MPRKLNDGERRLVRLIAAETLHGWATVSKAVYPLVQNLPSELVEAQPRPIEGGRARLTAQGEAVLYAMDWLS